MSIFFAVLALIIVLAVGIIVSGLITFWVCYLRSGDMLLYDLLGIMVVNTGLVVLLLGIAAFLGILLAPWPVSLTLFVIGCIVGTIEGKKDVFDRRD